MIRIKLFILSCVILLGGSKYPSGSSVSQIPRKDFFKMEGVTVTHLLENSKDSLSDNKVIELQDQNGLTVWFGRYFFKDICTTGICRMVRLWIFWDGTGNYLGIQLNEDDPLTKSDHSPFALHDYTRLDEILADTVSILKDLRYEDLTVEEEVEDGNISLFEVDGYSSATTPLLKEYVIDDAVFTCYTLWHTVYGETKDYIDNLLRERMNVEYITHLINGNDNQQLFALESIRQQNSYFPQFESRILNLITSQDSNIADKALSLITPEYLTDSKKQSHFVGLIKDARSAIKYEIIYRMQLVEKVSPDAIITLLDLFYAGDISQGALNHIFRIIEKQMAVDKSIKEDKAIQERLGKLASHPDPYTSRLTKNFMEKMK